MADATEVLRRDDGTLWCTCPLVNGQRHGLQQTFSRDGSIEHQATYDNGLLEGQETFFYPCGAIRQTTNYTLNSAEGQEVEYYRDGSLKRTVMFIDDRKRGLELYYHQGQQHPWKEIFWYPHEGITLKENGKLLVNKLTYLVLTGSDSLQEKLNQNSSID